MVARLEMNIQAVNRDAKQAVTFGRCDWVRELLDRFISRRDEAASYASPGHSRVLAAQEPDG